MQCDSRWKPFLTLEASLWILWDQYLMISRRQVQEYLLETSNTVPCLEYTQKSYNSTELAAICAV